LFEFWRKKETTGIFGYVDITKSPATTYPGKKSGVVDQSPKRTKWATKKRHGLKGSTPKTQRRE